MEIGIVLKMIGIGFLAAFGHTLLKVAGREEFSFWVTAAALIVAFLVLVPLLGDLFGQVQSVFRLN